jgi:hypothetical protein
MASRTIAISTVRPSIARRDSVASRGTVLAPPHQPPALDRRGQVRAGTRLGQ